MRQAIKKIHENHSHAPYKDSLVRYLKHGKASRHAQREALFRCGVCESEARHASRPVAAMPRYKEFNEAITMDFMIVMDLVKNMHVILVIVDMASDFTVAVYVCPGSRPTAGLARKSFELGWLISAGPPQ